VKRSGKLRATLFLAATALVICIWYSPVFAHAKLLRTQPENNATIKQPPQDVELWFNEELQPQFNTITVTDQNGKRVDKNNISLAEDNKKLHIDLENVGSGTYTVMWKVLSADQHTMKGQFTFKVEISSGGRRDTNTKQRTGRVAANTASRTYARSHRDFRFQYCTLVSVSGLDDVVRRLSISAADFKPSTASSGWFR